MKKDFLTILDRDTDELMWLIAKGIELKKERKNGELRTTLEGKSIALIFEKSSTRTRVSFEVGVHELGGYPLFLSANDIQLGRGESLKDTAKVLSRYVHCIMVRTFAHSRVAQLATYATIPVINGLTDDFHPCQIMADVMTFFERYGKYKGIKVAYIGDGNNIAHSWLNAAARFGFDLTVASPKGCEVNSKILADALEQSKKSGARIVITDNPEIAVKGAHVVTTDVWASMGQEADAARKALLLSPYQVNSTLMKKTAVESIFLHCLPAHLGEEVTEEVFESSNSLVFDEAENRLHIQKAIMLDVLK